MEDQKCLKKPFVIQSSYTEIHELVDHHGPPLLVWNSIPKKSKTEKDTQHLRYDPTKNTKIRTKGRITRGQSKRGHLSVYE